MARTRGAAISLLAGGALLAALAGAGLAKGSGPKVLFHGRLYGNIPNVTVRGVPAGAAPWVVTGAALLRSDGQLVVHGEGLVIPPGGYLADGKPVPKKLWGTTAGVTKEVAALTCAQGTVVTTPAVPLTRNGNFSINTKIQLPASCYTPVILVGPPGPNGQLHVWFASTNFLKYGLWGKNSEGWGSSSGSGTTSSSSSWGSGKSKSSSSGSKSSGSSGGW